MLIRKCLNCDKPIKRNPETKHFRWFHTDTHMRFCNSPDAPDNCVAAPAPIVLDDDITHLLVGARVWYRESSLWPDRDKNRDRWTSMIMGHPTKSTTELLNMAEKLPVEVYVLARRERLL